MIVIVVSGLQMYFLEEFITGYSKQLFLIMPRKYDVSNIPHFYKNLNEHVVNFLTLKSDTT